MDYRIPTVSMVKGDSHINVNKADVPMYKKQGYKIDIPKGAASEDEVISTPHVVLTEAEKNITPWIDAPATETKPRGRPKK